MSVKIFFCYAREDEPLLKKLKAHLRPLQRKGLIDVWYDRDINAGTDWEREIDKQLNTSQIVLLLVSPDFIDSDYCYSVEMKRALERHQQGEAWVIPIILRQSYWQEEPFSKLQVLPKDAKPVKSWLDLDEAFFDVAEGIRKAVKEQLIKQGNDYYEAGQYEEALTIIEQSVQIDPQNAHQYKNKGDVLSKLGRNEEAIKAFEQAITFNPKYATAYNNMAWSLNELKRYEDALKACERAIEIDTYYAPAYRNKGRAYYELKQYQNALDAYNQAILLDPKNSNGYESKGEVLYLLERYKEALIAYERAIELDQEKANLFFTKGLILRELKQFQDALDAFEQAIQLDPNFFQALEEKGKTLQLLKHTDEAQEEINKARQIRYNSSLIEVTIESVRINPETDQRVIILQELKQKRYLFIWVAHQEAYNIAIKLQGTTSPRPLAFDLFKNILEGIGASVTMAIVSEIVEDIFYGCTVVKIADKEFEFDSRPADAIALALCSNAPIFVENSVMETAGVKLETEEESKG